MSLGCGRKPEQLNETHAYTKHWKTPATSGLDPGATVIKTNPWQEENVKEIIISLSANVRITGHPHLSLSSTTSKKWTSLNPQSILTNGPCSAVGGWKQEEYIISKSCYWDQLHYLQFSSPKNHVLYCSDNDTIQVSPNKNWMSLRCNIATSSYKIPLISCWRQKVLN